MGPPGEYVWMDLGDDVGTADNFGGGGLRLVLVSERLCPARVP